MRSKHAFRTILLGMVTLGLVACGGSDGRGSGSGGSDSDSGGTVSGNTDDYGKACTRTSDCADTCIFDSYGAKSSGMCTHQCNSSSDCPENVGCEKLDSSPRTVCVPRTPCTTGDPGLAAVCADMDPSKPFGIECSNKQQVPAGCTDFGAGAYCCDKPL
jgi:hypothetical protein